MSLQPIDKAGHCGNLTAAQEKTLHEFEERLTQDGVLPDALLDSDEQRTTVLLRFLRAREWSVENASKMYNDSQRWRKEVDLLGMMRAQEAGKNVFEERQTVADDGWKMYFHQTDRYNRPIFIQDLSYLKVNDVFVHTTPERIIHFFALMLEGAVQRKYAVCTELSRQQARKAGTTDGEALKKIVIDDNFMILNVEGLGMGTFWSFKNQLQQLLGILDANFPELSGRVQIINAPWLFTTIFSYIKGWLPVNTVAKIGIAGADFHDELFEYIDPAALPTTMGGTCECKQPGGCAFSDKGPWQVPHIDPSAEPL